MHPVVHQPTTRKQSIEVESPPVVRRVSRSHTEPTSMVREDSADEAPEGFHLLPGRSIPVRARLHFPSLAICQWVWQITRAWVTSPLRTRP